MTRRRHLPGVLAALLCSASWSAGCSGGRASSEAHVVAPAAPEAEDPANPAQAELPSGVAPPADEAQAAPSAPDERAPGAPGEPTSPAQASAAKDVAKPATATATASGAKPGSAVSATGAKADATPAPDAPAEAAKPAAPTPARGSVRVPSTAHVRVTHSAGMQQLLDADPRMQPWLDKVIAVADGCYARERAKDAEAGGVIAVSVTMHANARPTPDIETLPASLAGLVPCATGELMRNRPPLFTGPEGQRQRIEIHFTP